MLNRSNTVCIMHAFLLYVTRSSKIRNKSETLNLTIPLQGVCEGVNLAVMVDFQVFMFLINVTILDCCHDIIRA